MLFTCLAIYVDATWNHAVALFRRESIAHLDTKAAPTIIYQF